MLKVTLRLVTSRKTDFLLDARVVAYALFEVYVVLVAGNEEIFSYPVSIV